MTSNRLKVALNMILLTVFPAAFWYGYYHVIEGLRGTPLTIWHTSPNNWTYLVLGLAALAFSMTMPIRIAKVASLEGAYRILISLWALGVILMTAAGGLLILWIIGCYGWGYQCI